MSKEEYPIKVCLFGNSGVGKTTLSKRYLTGLYDSNIKRVERLWKLSIPRNRVLYTSSDSPDIYTDLSATNKQFGERLRDEHNPA